jgi:hypothetical protein
MEEMVINVGHCEKELTNFEYYYQSVGYRIS